MVISISRNFTNESFVGSPTLDDKISVFNDRVLGWQIDIAEALRMAIEDPSNSGKPIQHGGFALLAILFSYFEMIAQYHEGRNSDRNSGKFFGKGLEAVFPKRFSKPQKAKIYSLIRCGLYHSALTKKGVLISGGYPDAIAIDKDGVKVNPHRLSPEIKTHFVGYVKDLKNSANSSLRGKFEKMFDHSSK